MRRRLCYFTLAAWDGLTDCGRALGFTSAAVLALDPIAPLGPICTCPSIDAPSAMDIRAAMMSPVILPLGLISTRSLACTLP